jgi:anaerobic magnesium-protoporphyrin IX monomethyl ester cyclase
MVDTICLVIPPSGFLLDERVFPSLGILKVAAALREAGITVDVLDLSGIKNYEDVVRDYLSQNTVSTYGITTTTPQLPAACRIIECMRQGRAAAKIILGGPHITLTNAAAKLEVRKNTPSRACLALESLKVLADVLVVGDGELSVLLAMKSDAPNIIDADDRASPLYLTSPKLEDTLWPARDLIDLGSYHYQIDGKEATTIIAQLGCPFGCAFCGGRLSPSLRNIRTRTADNIVAEMLHLNHHYGYQGFMLYDDELNVNTKMVELMNKIRDAQQRQGQEWCLRGFIKAELFTSEQAQAMYEAGFRWILVGFESGSPRILENIQKRATREENTRCMQIAHKHGLKVKALMSLGHPGETYETAQETARWLCEVYPDDFDLTIITTYPGTPYYDNAVPVGADVWVYTAKNGDKLYSYDINFENVTGYYKGKPGEYSAYVYTESLSSHHLVLLRDFIEQMVRHDLGIPFNHNVSAQRYEHSMGQLPSSVFRKSR